MTDRANRCWAAAAIGALVLATLVPAGSASAATVTTASAANPTVSFANPEVDRLIGSSYAEALKNLLVTNNVPYEAKFNSTGFLKSDPGTFFRAGGFYALPWTRDASVNSWNAGSLLAPDVASNTLWAVVTKEAGEDSLIVQQHDVGQESEAQWWDQVVWIVAAWNQYLVTGDDEFLGRAYTTAVNTLNARRERDFNARVGLFQGPSFFNDGIAGYPESIAGTESHGSFIDGGSGTSYPRARTQLALSTNALYYQAYQLTAAMAERLGADAGTVSGFQDEAASIKTAINAHLWNDSTHQYGYTLVKTGTDGDSAENYTLENYQEGAGIAFALQFGIADGARADEVLASVQSSPWGVTDVWPAFSRYSDTKQGRHNNSIWPMVQSFWGAAAATAGGQEQLSDEILNLSLLQRGSGDFSEIYNSITGEPDGGWQTGSLNSPRDDQTWSASGYLRMILNGVFGVGLTTEGMTLTPTLPAGWGDATITGLPYRQATLDITLRGAGNEVSAVSLDGAALADAVIPSDLTGSHSVVITLTGADGTADYDSDGTPDATDQCLVSAGTTELQGCPDGWKIEAEDAVFTNTYRGGDAHAGASGGDFAGRMWDQGDSVAFQVGKATSASQPGSVVIRYANGYGDNRTLSLYSGSDKVGQVAFPPTGSWDSWSEVTVPGVDLTGSPGALTLQWDAGDNGRVNLDWIGFRATDIAITDLGAEPIVAGSPVDQQLAASGGHSPVSFAVTSGTLPAGLGLTTGGHLTGTLTEPGSYSFTVTVTDADGKQTAVPVALTVTTTTTTTLTLSAATQTRGAAPVQAAVAVAAGSGTAKPSGTVEILDGSAVIASGALVDGAVTVALPATLSVGAHHLTARYPESDPRWEPSASDPRTLTVTKAAPQLTVTTSRPSVVAGTASVATVVVKATGVVPTGTVTLSESGKTLATVRLGAGGRATVTLPAFTTAGSHTVQAAYQGSSEVSAANGQVRVGVTKAASAVKAKAKKSVKRGKKLTVKVAVSAPSGLSRSGVVRIKDGKRTVATVKVGAAGSKKVKIHLSKRVGKHKVKVTFTGNAGLTSVSKKVTVKVRR